MNISKDDRPDFFKIFQDKISSVNQFIGISLTVYALLFIVIEYELIDRRVLYSYYWKKCQELETKRNNKTGNISKDLYKIYDSDLPNNMQIGRAAKDAISLRQIEPIDEWLSTLKSQRSQLIDSLESTKGPVVEMSNKIRKISTIRQVLKSIKNKFPTYLKDLTIIDTQIQVFRDELETIPQKAQSIPTPFGTFQIHPRMGLLLLIMASLPVYFTFWLRRKKIQHLFSKHESRIKETFLFPNLPYWLFPLEIENKFSAKTKTSNCALLELLWFAFVIFIIRENYRWELIEQHWVGQIPFVEFFTTFIIAGHFSLVIHHFFHEQVARLFKRLLEWRQAYTMSPKRRKIAIGLFSALVVAGSGTWWLRYFFKPKVTSAPAYFNLGSFTNSQLIKNSTTGVIHHRYVCAGHLPMVDNREKVSDEIPIGRFHGEQSLSILEELADLSEDLRAIDIFLEIISRDPSRLHIYDRLISLWGKLKEYDEIHRLLENSIRAVTDQIESTDIAFKEKKKLERLKNSLNLRLDKAKMKRKQ